MSAVSFEKDRPYYIVEIQGKPYMFTNSRIVRKTLPENYFAYDVRDSDDCDGTFAEIAPFVFVNHWGTIIGKEPIVLDENQSYIPTSEESEYPFTDEHCDYKEYEQRFYSSFNRR